MTLLAIGLFSSKQVKIDEEKKKEDEGKDTKGIPEFWCQFW